MCGFFTEAALSGINQVMFLGKLNGRLRAACFFRIFIQQQLIEVAKPGEDMGYPRIVFYHHPGQVPDGQFTGQTIVRIARDNPDEQPDD